MKLISKFMLLSVLFIIGCSGGNTPESVALEFAEAYYRLDFDGARKYCTKHSQSKLEKTIRFIEEFREKAASENKVEELDEPKIAFQNCEISEDGEKAVVHLSVESVLMFKMKSKEGPSDVRFELMKEDGKWKVVYDGK